MTSTINQTTPQAISQLETTSSLAGEKRQGAIIGDGFTKEMWYFGAPGYKVKRGKMLQKTIMGMPILIGRDAAGKPFAMVDICPHQGFPLSSGNFDGKEIECCFHGWRFDTSGGCTEIPALCDDQKMNLCSVKTKSYQCAEHQGNIWVYVGDKTTDLPEIPTVGGLDNHKCDQTTTTLTLPNHIDYNVLALIDTAHVPYVHNAWWWRNGKNIKEKAKQYVPDGTGWTMVRHKPSKHSVVFKMFGDIMQTEIGFRLPGCRLEYITFNDRTLLAGISTLTPIDENTTELNHTTYWTVRGFKLIVEPIVQYFVTTFLSQDKVVAEKQQPALKMKPQLIYTIKDSGTPGRWYLDCKREWNNAAESGQPFNNPIKATILRWRT